MTSTVFKDLALSTDQINAVYPLKQLNILNQSQIADNAYYSAHLNALEDINTSAQAINTNIIYGRHNVAADVGDHSNLVVGDRKTRTVNNGKTMENTEGATVIGHGQLANGIIIPNNVIMIGKDCAPPQAGEIAFGNNLTAPTNNAPANIADLDQRLIIQINGIRYYLYLDAV
jgi:archaellum component FlaF (FlaF/FlaG flagellin family)